MIKNHKFLSLFAITLVAALLLSVSSRATSVYALADPVQAIAPVYDTQIYQLQDYIEHGGLSSSQLDIFYTLAGFYVLGQAGSTGYRLRDPFSNSDDVWDWLKSCGIEIYNTVIGLIPDTARMPITGDIYSTVPFKKASQLYVATLMGAAVKAATFPDYQTFKDEVENSGTYWLPWNLDVQKGMNSIFGIYDGIYEWQFESAPFKSNISWNVYQISDVLQDSLDNAYEAQGSFGIRVNTISNNVKNAKAFSDLLIDYHNLFINTSTNRINITNDSGQSLNTNVWSRVIGILNGNSIYNSNVNVLGYYNGFSYNPNNYTKYVDIVQDVYDFVLKPSGSDVYKLYYEDFIQHVYVGSNWLNKTEIQNIQDLNFDEPTQNYYVAPESELDLFLDIKGILDSILNNTNLYYVFMNNLFKQGGVPVQDEELIRITTDIYDLLEQTNPVLPVNLNDISELTNNTYLDLIKEHGENFGETIGEYVAFWHNSDPEITYVIFGALILTLIGAFVGKWGHS